MPETKTQRDDMEKATDEEVAKRIKQEWLAVSDLLDKAEIPSSFKTADIKLPPGIEIDDAGKRVMESEEVLFLSLPERIDFVIAKTAFFEKAARTRKTSDFAPLSRFMAKVEKEGKHIYFILQSDGTCYVANERSGAPSKVWATVDEMAVDMTLKEQGR